MYYILKNNLPTKCLNIEEWEAWMSEDHNIIVRHTRVHETELSTTFMGANYGPNLDKFFETVVHGGKYDGYRKEYATYAEAEAGHAEALDVLLELQEEEEEHYEEFDFDFDYTFDPHFS